SDVGSVSSTSNLLHNNPSPQSTFCHPPGPPPSGLKRQPTFPQLSESDRPCAIPQPCSHDQTYPMQTISRPAAPLSRTGTTPPSCGSRGYWPKQQLPRRSATGARDSGRSATGGYQAYPRNPPGPYDGTPPPRAATARPDGRDERYGPPPPRGP